MAHQYQHTFAEWAKNGSKITPSASLQNTGFVAGMKPPAGVFNHQWDEVGKAITELQEVTMTTEDATALDSLSAVAKSGSWNDLLNKPAFKAVATSGRYSDLSGRPSLATVATTGSYNDLTNKPNICRVTHGSYTGTESYSVTLTFPFTPRIVIVAKSDFYYNANDWVALNRENLVLTYGITKLSAFDKEGSQWDSGDTFEYEISVIWSGNSVTWQSQSGDLYRIARNERNQTYYYVALG